MAKRRICKIRKCGKVHYSLGYCRNHHAQLKRRGDPLAEPLCAPKGSYTKVCKTKGCNRFVRTRGLCAKHYNQWWCLNLKTDEHKQREILKRKKWYAKPENKAKVLANGEKYRRASPRQALWHALRQGLKRRPIKNPATVDDLMEMWKTQKGRCALSGKRMIWSGGGRGNIQENSVSVDRIVPWKSYSLDNLRLICWRLNTMRGPLTDKEMFRWMKIVLERNRKL